MIPSFRAKRPAQLETDCVLNCGLFMILVIAENSIIVQDSFLSSLFPEWAMICFTDSSGCIRELPETRIAK